MSLEKCKWKNLPMLLSAKDTLHPPNSLHPETKCQSQFGKQNFPIWKNAFSKKLSQKMAQLSAKDTLHTPNSLHQNKRLESNCILNFCISFTFLFCFPTIPFPLQTHKIQFQHLNFNAEITFWHQEDLVPIFQNLC